VKKYRIPLWLPAALTLLATVGVRYENYRIQERTIIADLATRKGYDAQLIADFLAARIANATHSQEEQRSVLNSAIDERHRSTLIVVQAEYPNLDEPMQLADNASNLKPGLFDGIPDRVEQIIGEYEDKFGGVPKSGIEFDAKGSRYLIHEKTFSLTTPKGQAGAGIIVPAEVILVTNLSAATEETREVALYWGATLAIVVLLGVGFVILVNVSPLNTITKQLRRVDPIVLGWWVPRPIANLANQINADRAALIESNNAERIAKEMAEGYARQIEENQRIWRHDLLSNIKGVYDMFELLNIIGFTVEDDDHRKTYEMARSAAESAYTLVKETRQLGDLEATIKLTPLNVSDIFDTLSAKYSQNNVILNYPKSDIIVLADTNQFTNRALVNLINNAIRYSNPPNERVEVSAVEKGDSVHFLIKDNGLGISPEGIEKIMGGMGEGVRLNPEIPGSGLGLYSVRRILQAHGGALTVKSKMGEGSIFIATVKKYDK
jgi:signal transduction histidine kinase